MLQLSSTKKVLVKVSGVPPEHGAVTTDDVTLDLRVATGILPHGSDTTKFVSAVPATQSYVVAAGAVINGISVSGILIVCTKVAEFEQRSSALQVLVTV